MNARRQHAAHGLKSHSQIRDPKVARRQLGLMLEVVEVSEAELRNEQELLGDACKELREAHGLTQRDIAAEGSFADVAAVKQIERVCPAEAAKRYCRAVHALANR
jgi:hypothetical protein